MPQKLARRLLLAAAGCAALALGCGAEPPAPPVAEDVLAQLRAIGYVAGSEDARGDASGVSQHDPERAQPGLNLVVSGHGPLAQLIDPRGAVVHEWRAEFADLFPDHPDAPDGLAPWQSFWRHAQLLPDGSLLAIWNTYGIFKLDRDSRILWARPNRAHHDLFVTGDGRILHLALETTRLPELGDVDVADDLIVTLGPDGAERRRVRISESLRNADWPALRRAFWEREAKRATHIQPAARLDPFHTNALWLLSEEEATRLGPPFRAGQALVSMCLLDTIAAIDLAARRAAWWQTGPFALQHQPRPTRDGHIVLFNNHAGTRRSSVQIVAPDSGDVVWEYTGPADEPLYSTTSSSAEVLPNGNVLIVETNPGRVLEVTRDREIVWAYRNPHRVGAGEDKVAAVFQVDRVGEALLGWLDGEGRGR